jgi:hemerythrin
MVERHLIEVSVIPADTKSGGIIMALMNWSEKFSVGVASMDAQHQKWFGILNRLHDAMLGGKAKDVQRAILAEMVAYTHTHFAQEETLLKTKGYPKLAEHQAKHAAFNKQVQDLEAKMISGASVLTHDVMDFLKHWLNDHILSTDTQYGMWLKEH